VIPPKFSVFYLEMVVCIILSIVTCGIYGIIWFINLTDDMKRASGDESLSGVKSFVLTLVTCGIYGFIWAYKMGKASYKAGLNYRMEAKDNSVLYLILQIFGLAIVNYCLIQNDLNNMANSNQNVNQPMQNVGQSVQEASIPNNAGNITNVNQPMQNIGQSMQEASNPNNIGNITNVNQPMQNSQTNIQNPEQTSQNTGV